MSGRDFYRNRDFISDFDAVMAETEARSRAFASRSSMTRDVRYGPTPRQQLDLVFPTVPEAAAPLHMFIHGPPVIEGAGGAITDWDGKALGLHSDGRFIAAASLELHQEAFATLS